LPIPANSRTVQPEREPRGDQGEAEEDGESGDGPGEAPTDVSAGGGEDDRRHNQRDDTRQEGDRTELAPSVQGAPLGGIERPS
jgi:hypothetical protein